MTATVLLVEDDPTLRLAVTLALEDEGHHVAAFPDGEQALDAAADTAADLAILDVGLPGMDGFELCRALRRQSDLPILMLTARTDSHDEVAGLEAGADDYVAKPVQPKVLAARVRALLRRATSTSGPSVVRFGALEVHPEGATVRLHGEPVDLTKIEFLLLCEFVASPGQVLSRETLLDRVWGYNYLGQSRLVDVAVRRLRAKVEDDPTRPQRIVTLRGLGYRFEPDPDVAPMSRG
jgi:DNA-binding response OmpR family regulator